MTCFADLNGTFVDSDHDGLYDDHTGNVAPEIWVGRLYTRPLTWDDEVRLLKHYFYKNHLYRTGGLILPDRGCASNDEDWSGSGNCGMTAIYPTVTVIEDSRTTAANYRTELVNGYEWIHVMAHSSAWGNTFRSSSSNYTGTVFNCEMYALQPRCHFYNLFACSGARFTEENYSAGWMVFNDDWGLFAVGSTKTGSMYPGHVRGLLCANRRWQLRGRRVQDLVHQLRRIRPGLALRPVADRRPDVETGGMQSPTAHRSPPTAGPRPLTPIPVF